MDVMIFDDDPYASDLIATVAEEEGFGVEKHIDGLGALEKIRASRPRLVVADVMMPGMDGISLCRALRADPALAGIPVLVCSGKQYEEDRQRALSAGAAGYFTKPLELARLREAIRRCLPSASLAVPAPAAQARPPAFQARIWGCQPPGEGRRSYCLSLEFGPHRLILDAGTGLADLVAGPPPEDRQLWMLLSRHHSEHMAGLGALASWLRQGCVIRVAGPGDMTEASFVFVRSLPGTGASQAQFYQLSEGPFQLWPAVTLSAIFANHPGPTMCFRLDCGGRSLVYCPDNELEDPEDVPTDFSEKLLRFARGADVLVHDARHRDEDHTRGQGHSCPALALDLAVRAGARRLVLFQLAADPAEAQRILGVAREQLRQRRSTLRLDAADAGLTLEV